ncbi:MAG: Crp/Fnr family transcriptional regulator [Gammaproteobacteria bacterium]|nr:hypothetical protein [Gammaproteobacteria bacterium]
MSRLNRRRSSHAHVADCADCTASHRCWEQPLPARAGFLVKRHAVFTTGTSLFQQGERFNAVYIVISGCMKLRETDETGAEHIVAVRLPGELVGLEGWASGRYPHGAVAAIDTKVCQLLWPYTNGSVRSYALLEQLLKKAARQLEHSSHIWMSLPAVERVAAFLAYFAQRTGIPFELPLTRAEVGSLLGLAEETVVRALATLRAQRRLRMQGRRIEAISRGTPLRSAGAISATDRLI